MSEIVENIKEVVNSSGYYFIDAKVRGTKQYPVIEVFIDSDSGVSVSDCSKISKIISQNLDKISSIGNYRLDVSSPGIDVPLKEEWQFIKNINRKIEVQYFFEQNKIRVNGTLVEIDLENITIEDDKNNKIKIIRKQILLAKIII